MVLSKKPVVILLIISVLISAYTYACVQRSGKKLRGIDISFSLPILLTNGELMNVRDTLSIYYYGNYILCRIPYIYLHQKKGMSTQEKRNSYLVYYSGERIGSFYEDSLNSVDVKKVNVDSTLKSKFFTDAKFYESKKDSLVEVAKNEEGYSLVEKYVQVNKNGISSPDSLTTIPDTLIYYYSNGFKNITYSLSNELDSLKGLKVSKIRFIFNSRFYKGYAFKFPYREFHIEIKNAAMTDRKKITSFLETLKNRSQRY